MLSQKKSNSKRQVLPRLVERLVIGVIAGATLGIFLPVFSSASAQSVQVIGDDASTPRLFSIPAQRLSIALAQFGRQSGLQVVFPANVPQGMNSSAVSGMMTAQQALSLLLQGTGIDWYISRQGAIVGTDQTLDGAQGSDFSGDTSLLDTIIVADPNNQNAISGSGFQGTPDWVYASPSAVSVISRETIKNAPVRETRDLLDNVAGVYANRSEAQNPGITVSVRGLQDQNRVVTMVDGARQNFQRNGHGSTQRTYVDTAFLREIDIEKSGTSGVGGAGALGGSVNFRSLNASDLIKPGREWGFEGTVATGTNAFEFDGSGTVAVRVSDAFSVLAGISHKKIGEYNIGKNGDLEVSNLTVDDNAVVSTGSEVFSTFLKAEAQFTDDLKGSLAWMRNDSEFTHGGYSTGRETFTENSQHVVNNTITATLDWNPDSDLVDMKARLWYNHLENAEVRGATATNNYTDWPVDYSLGTLGASLDNTSEFVTPFGSLSLNYGAEAFWDRGSTDSDTFYSTNEGTHDFTASYTGMTPSGNRDVYSAFANATLDHGDWLTLSGGLRYDYYKLHGNASIYGYERIPGTCILYHPRRPERCVTYSEATRSYPETVLDIDQSEGALLPSAMIAVKPFDWLQPFVKYSRSMRPPSIMETFFTGGHPGVNITQNAPNPDLKAESGNTFEIGANISHNGLFTDRGQFPLQSRGLLPAD
ncbi:TonB-dependent receptor domain-containing protein [uncultured Cohaesibacter sp.]|uniref:TonB-dependent receptor n=1 Tax=uncultured Cohaesibacter sp. TaxID=1002546 RepID=UPI0029C67656|nr:TonB-dependent receptor [uncultured Cohaesibacter sp.]